MSPESTETAAFHKAYKNLAFFWILKAGHMVSTILLVVGYTIISEKTEDACLLPVCFLIAAAYGVLSSLLGTS